MSLSESGIVKTKKTEVQPLDLYVVGHGDCIGSGSAGTYPQHKTHADASYMRKASQLISYISYPRPHERSTLESASTAGII